MKFINPLDIPEFSNLADFAEWYMRSGVPILIPDNREVFLSDDATATCFFRHGRYQFEMYFVHPEAKIPMHEHPGVENIEIPSGSWDFTDKNLRGRLEARIQKHGMAHGPSSFSNSSPSGFALFSAQKWDEGLEISTIGARWKGPTVGPKHEALIRRFNPNCLIRDGYADVTRQVS